MNNSLVLLNSEPLLDYPRPTVHRVIDIGGIATATEADPLDEVRDRPTNYSDTISIVLLNSLFTADLQSFLKLCCLLLKCLVL